jgi:hypothetical protein
VSERHSLPLSDFEANNVLFQKEDPKYIGKLLAKVVSSA